MEHMIVKEIENLSDQRVLRAEMRRHPAGYSYCGILIDTIHDYIVISACNKSFRLTIKKTSAWTKLRAIPIHFSNETKSAKIRKMYKAPSISTTHKIKNDRTFPFFKMFLYAMKNSIMKNASYTIKPSPESIAKSAVEVMRSEPRTNTLYRTEYGPIGTSHKFKTASASIQNAEFRRRNSQ